MIIRGWSIDGYGVFHEEECRGLGDGLTVILGPNESGKSTLISFVRGMLFGFPDRRSKDPLHPPLHGGRHGGRLFLETADGPVIVEREAGRFRPPVVTLPGGGRGAGAEMDEILGGLDLPVFRNVFAFGLSELSDFASLGAGGIGERLLSAGITGAGRSAREAIEMLGDQAASLLRPRGRSDIGETLEQLARMEERIAAAREELATHPGLVGEEEDQQGELARLSRDADRLREEEKRLERLLELWPSWHQRRQAIERLALFPNPEDREDPKHQLNRLVDRLETAADQHVEPQAIDTPGWTPAAVLAPLLWFLSAAAAAGVAWRLRADDWPVAALCALGAAAAAVAAMFFGKRRRLALRARELEAEERERRDGLSAARLAAAARDLAGLRQTLSGTAERQSLEQTVQQVDSLVAARAGGDEQALSFVGELDRGMVETWERELDSTKARLAEAAEQRDQAIRRLETVRRQREALERSADLPTLETGAEALRSRLEEETGQWRLLVIARGLVGEALREFTAGRQPAVLERASRLFRTVTGGRYDSVVQESDGNGLTLLAGDGRRVETHHLSRGTAEQLYLCLRLALAEDFSGRGRPVPLLMDDVLVNADPERARGMADAIREYAGRGGQVILFTCHPATAALFDGFGNEAVIRRLKSHGGNDH